MPENSSFGGDFSIGGVIGEVAGKVAGALGGESGGALFTFEAGPYRMGQLGVLSFEGREEISKTYAFEVHLAASGVDLFTLETALLGQSASLGIMLGDGARRYIHGVVASVTYEGMISTSNQEHLRVRLVPRLWLAKRNKRTRIFQDLTVEEIVKAVLKGVRVEHDFKLLNKYQKRVYCVQYQESDLAFVARLCAEEGIFFFFEQPDGALSELTGGVTGLVGAAAGVAGSLLGGVAGEVAGEVAAALDPGEKVIFADRPEFYPAIDEGGEASGGISVTGAATSIAGALGQNAAVGQVSAAAASVGLTLGGSPALLFRDQEGMLPMEHYVSAFGLRRSLKSKATLLKDYDFKRPALDLRSTASTVPSAGSNPLGAAANLTASVSSSGMINLGATFDLSLPTLLDPRHYEVYDHHGEDEDPDVTRQEAQTQLEQYRARGYVGEGTSWCRRLAPGHRFMLDDHPIEKLNREYVVTKVMHRGRTAVDFGRDAARHNRDQEQSYRNTFECSPAHVPVRPKRPRRKIHQVLETARVVGPRNEDIYTDFHGRIKVQFHWDLAGTHNEYSSCWIRVSQAWAGANWGFQFIPRVGMEVLVSFLSGDQDRPVVVGCLYNGENPTTFAVPDDRSRSGIRTQSYPRGSGYNEFSFEDKVGEEQVYLRAQRDLDEIVRHDHTLKVDRDEHTIIGHDQKLEVLHDQTNTIGGHHGESVGGNRTEFVHGRRTTVVGETDHVSIGGHLSVGVKRNINFRAGQYFNTNVAIEDEPGGHNTWVWGNYNLGTSDSVYMNPGKEFRITVGESTLVMTPDEVRIEAKTIVVAAGETATMVAKGPALTLTEVAELVAKEITLKSKGSTLFMDDKMTKVMSGSLLLTSGEGGEAEERKKVTGETKPLKLKLTNDEFEPYANRPYDLVVDGIKFKGTTDGDGAINTEVPKDAKLADLTVWVGDPPTGSTRAWQIALVETLPPETEVSGLQLRLKNLGYLQGVNGEVDETTHEAIRNFQIDHEMEPTGEPADAAGKIKEIHGS